jgi:hypothetical protein
VAVPAHHDRTAYLAKLGPRGLYRDHVTQKILRDATCTCTLAGPSYTCDVGYALWRVAETVPVREPARGRK